MSETNPTRSELKRHAILQAARDAFQEHGVHNTSMDELAALAQVSKRTVYNHFASKEVLIMTLMAELWQQATVHEGRDYDPDADLHSQLCALIELEIEVICSQQYIDLNRVAFADDRLQQLDHEVASQQVHSLIKGGCFWPQLMQITPLLTVQERRELASQTTALFLSHYQK